MNETNRYFQLPTHQELKIIIEEEKMVYDRDFKTDEIIQCQKLKIAQYWIKHRLHLLCFLTVLPFILYPLETLKKTWITSFLGLLACCLPSGGAPIAGGIIFLPSLQLIGLSSKQAVAFCTATQSFGCGVFAPLNWLDKDQGILIKNTIPLCLLFGSFGLIFAFQNPLAEHQVGLLFACFCLFLASTVVYGLFHDLTTQNEPVKFRKITTLKGIQDYSLYIIGSLIGGMIAGWIGIGIEKIYFLLATSYHKAELRRATISAIALIGWLSSISCLVHFFILKDVPISYWVSSLPGVLLGSIVGPIINKYLGSFNVMIIFCIFLFLNVIYEFTK